MKGETATSEAVDTLCRSLLRNRVPEVWSQVSYPSFKPLSSWFRDLVERVNFMDTWLRQGNPNSYWLSGMFYPHGFLSSVLQHHARYYKVTLENLAYEFEVAAAETPQEVERSAREGVYVHGLFLDGARWDREAQIMAD